MAVSFAWSFSALDVIIENAEGLAEVVYTIHWRYSATTDDAEPYTASTIGTSSVTYDPDGPDPFIPFEDLTEAVVQNWTEEQITEEGVEQMESSLAANIERQINPTHETFRTMPWDESNGA
jgi:hypothetical protein